MAKLGAVGAFIAVGVFGTALVFLANADPYGWTLFTILPFAASVVSAMVLKGMDRKAEFTDASAVALIGLAVIAAGILIVAFEGLLCIGMSLPLVIPEVLLGSALGLRLMKRNDKVLSISVLAFVPVAVWADSRFGPAPFEDVVSTSTTIAAPPEAIWPFLQDLDLAAPRELLFRVGVAHPTATRTHGQDRECILSTGIMRERIEVFETGRRLKFRVLNTPPTMKELNPFGPVHARHLVGFYECQTGEFRLTPQADGTTLVEGISEYSCRIGPAAYWQLWTRKIVHDVHNRVFEAIREKVEPGPTR